MPRTSAVRAWCFVKKLPTEGREGSVRTSSPPNISIVPGGTSTPPPGGFGSTAYEVSHPPKASTMNRFFGVPTPAARAWRCRPGNATATVAAAADHNI